MDEENTGKMVLKKEDLQKMDNGEFTEEDVEKYIRKYENGQVYFMGLPIGTAKNQKEYHACITHVIEIMLNPKIDTWSGLQKLREKVYKGNMSKLIPKFKPIMYKGGSKADYLVEKVTGKPLIYMDADEILEAAKLFKHGKTSKQVVDIMLKNPYTTYTHALLSQNDFDIFEEYYKAGRLNKIIRWICNMSNQGEGFILHRSGKALRYLNEEDYLYRRIEQ